MPSASTIFTFAQMLCPVVVCLMAVRRVRPFFYERVSFFLTMVVTWMLTGGLGLLALELRGKECLVRYERSMSELRLAEETNEVGVVVKRKLMKEARQEWFDFAGRRFPRIAVGVRSGFWVSLVFVGFGVVCAMNGWIWARERKSEQ